MAEQIASLGMAIDSSSAKAAAVDLRALAESAGVSEDAIRAIGRAQSDTIAVTRRAHNENVRQREILRATAAANAQAAAAIRDRGAADNEATGAAARATEQLERTNRTVDHLGVRTESSARSYGAMVSAIMRGDFQQANASLATLASRMAIIPALTTPIGAAVAAVVASIIGLGAVAIRSMRQQDEYNRSIIATGNYANVTANDIRVMARELSDMDAHRIGDIEAALAAVVGTGQFAADSIMSVGAAVDNMGTVIGASVEESIAVFQRLGEKPSETLLELNKSYHFLTLEVYNNVRALENNGQAAEAARIAQGAFASELRRRAEDVRESGSIIAEAADIAKTAWQEALAAVSGWTNAIFGDLSDQERIIQLGEKMATLREKIDAPHVGEAYKKRYRAELETLEAERDAMIERRDLRKQREQEEADARRRESLATQAGADIDAIGSRFDKDLRYREERNKLEQAYRTLVNNSAWDELARRGVSYDVDTGKFSGGEYKKTLDAINAEAASRVKLTDAEREAQRVSRAQEATYARLSRQTEAYASELDLTADTGDKLSKVERYIRVTRDQLASGTLNLTAAQRASIEAGLDELEVGERRRRETEAANVALARETELRFRLAESMETAAAAAEREIASVGMSRRERELSAQYDRIANEALRERRRLIKEWGDEATETNEAYMAQLRMIDEYEQKRIDKVNWSAEARTKAEGNWSLGVSRALKDIQDETANYAGIAETVVVGAYRSMEDGLYRFARHGELRIKDMTVSILESMTQMAMRIAASNILMALFNQFMPSPTPGPGPTAIGANVLNNSRGNVFEAGQHVTNYARGGVFDRATYFPMAGGRSGRLGEEDTEAIMPLGRDSRGRLGVRTVGGSAGGGVVLNVGTTVNIDSSGNATSATSSNDAQGGGRQLGAMLTERIKSVLIEQARPGGILWGMQNGR